MYIYIYCMYIYINININININIYIYIYIYIYICFYLRVNPLTAFDFPPSTLTLWLPSLDVNR